MPEYLLARIHDDGQLDLPRTLELDYDGAGVPPEFGPPEFVALEHGPAGALLVAEHGFYHLARKGA